jgi:dolichol-phosphate mannosyltransferase
VDDPVVESAGSFEVEKSRTSDSERLPEDPRQDIPRVDISIVVPVRNEAESIEALAREIDASWQASPWHWECIWIDDGSTDGTSDAIARVARASPRHRSIRFDRSYGQSTALIAGFDASRGAFVGTLDGDGQNDPADLPILLARLIETSSDMVNGYRAVRHDSIVRRIASRVGNGVRGLVTDRTVRDVGCSTRVFRRSVLRDVPRFRNFHRFFPTLVALAGHRLLEVPVNHRPRARGRSKYGILDRLFASLFDLFGVYWLGRRVIAYRIVESSIPAPAAARPAETREIEVLT